LRETDTMDTFMDSSWYYLRYLDVNNTVEPFDSAIAKKEMPVDIYIGGIEHAMTHLFVSRLISHFLYDQGQLPAKEPFKRFIAMGMVKGETYKAKNGRYVPSDQVEEKGGKFYCKQTGEVLNCEFEKMSKSKLNGVDPQSMIQKYGVDFTRFFLLNFVHPRSDRNFSLSDDMVNGTLNMFQKTWSLIADAVENLESTSKVSFTEKDKSEINKLNDELNKTRNSQLNMVI
jgi:leucyl-tRNA synthetase